MNRYSLKAKANNDFFLPRVPSQTLASQKWVSPAPRRSSCFWLVYLFLIDLSYGCWWSFKHKQLRSHYLLKFLWTHLHNRRMCYGIFRLEGPGESSGMTSLGFSFSVFPTLVDRNLPEGEGPEEEKSYSPSLPVLLIRKQLLSLNLVCPELKMKNTIV